MTSALASAGLAAWLAAATLAVRRAERRVGDGRLPAPWPAIAASLAVCAASLALLPLGVAVTGSVVCIALVASAGADRRTGYLFDAVTLPTAALAAGLALACGRGDAAALGVLVTVGIFGGIYVASRGAAMGLGDVKALYAVGAALGPFGALLAVGLASVAGVALALASGRLRRREAVPFGPSLAAGACGALLLSGPLLGGLG